ncbi:putative ferric-chelate reductase 1 isoform X2 [Rhinichthys klamathensis goyatoka]|uniref:putative ferric-chelate reductase 1 isoform X2 n=1 Tax=Rhinichthys klamathensis goyatoka TaxID=3034132 RepID=UPI0024B5B390|nr:putative ferric-chelate reductase 1 isoform X2 [Rhinichthys klamathensis goyatoka]
MHVQFLILVFGLNLHAVTAFRNGQVTVACMSMTPGHGTNLNSTLEPPYTVTSDASNYTDGQVITVTLQANNTGFKGFLLQARNEKGPVGTFTVIGNNTQLLSCGTEGSAVSHTLNDVKSTIVAQWKAPNSNNTDIHFRATFVQNFSLFWVGVQSDSVRFLATNPPNMTVSPPNATVSTTNATVSTPNQTTDDSPSISLTWCLLFLPLLAII